MIKTKTVRINGKKYIRTYSNNGMMIERDGVLYEEAIDPIDSARVYVCTDQPIPPESVAEKPKGSFFRRVWNSLTGKAT